MQAAKAIQMVAVAPYLLERSCTVPFVQCREEHTPFPRVGVREPQVSVLALSNTTTFVVAPYITFRC